MSYANPVRLYLIVSLFFFFIFSGVGKVVSSDENGDTKISTSSNDNISNISNIEQITAEDLEDLKEAMGIGFKP